MDGAAETKIRRISLSDPFEWPPGWRVEVRGEGGVVVDIRLTGRGVLGFSALILVSAVWLGLQLVGTVGDGERISPFVPLFAILLAAVWLVWSLRRRLFPERLVVGPDRLDVMRGFLGQKVIASFGAGPIDVIRQVNDDGAPTKVLEVQVPAPFIGEPFVVFEGGDRDAVWVARLIAQETGWMLSMTPDARQPDVNNA